VKVQRTAPAKYDVAGIGKIIIVPVKAWGACGSSYTDSIVEKIAQTARDRSFYESVEIASADRSNMPSKADVKRIMRDQGADASLTVQIRDLDVDTDSDTIIIRRKGKYDYTFKEKCKECVGDYRYEKYYKERMFCRIPCVKKRGNAKARAIYMSRRSGRWVQDELSATRSYDAEGCDDVEKIPSDQEIKDSLSMELASQMADNITPHPVRYKTKLSTKKGCYKGNQLAKKGRWMDAIEAWQETLAVDLSRDGAVFNIGVAQEALGQYERALEFYNKALTMDSDDRYSEAIERIKQLMEERKRLHRQLESK